MHSWARNPSESSSLQVSYLDGILYPQAFIPEYFTEKYPGGGGYLSSAQGVSPPPTKSDLIPAYSVFRKFTRSCLSCSLRFIWNRRL